MLSLRWEDISLADAKLKVVGKGGKKSSVYMSQSLVGLLEAVPEETRQGYLLPSCRNRQGVYKRLESACRRAKVKFKGVHALRHSAGTRMLSESGNLVLVAEHLRHASLDTARGYAHQDNRALKKAVGGW